MLTPCDFCRRPNKWSWSVDTTSTAQSRGVEASVLPIPPPITATTTTTRCRRASNTVLLVFVEKLDVDRKLYYSMRTEFLLVSSRKSKDTIDKTMMVKKCSYLI